MTTQGTLTVQLGRVVRRNTFEVIFRARYRAPRVRGPQKISRIYLLQLPPYRGLARKKEMKNAFHDKVAHFLLNAFTAGNPLLGIKLLGISTPGGGWGSEGVTK